MASSSIGRRPSLHLARAVPSAAMTAVDATRIGDVEVVALVDGVADLSTPIVEAFPVAPADAILADRDRYPDLYGPGDTWRITVRAWLLRSTAGIVLMDTGVGPETSAAMAWFPDPGRLHDALEATGVAAADVGVVAISHVHDDHVGGALGPAGTPAFPNARYLLQRTDLEALEASASDDEEDRIVYEQMIRPLLAAGQLDLLDGDHRLGPEISLHHAPGHTPGHQVLRVTSGDERLLIKRRHVEPPLAVRAPGVGLGDRHGS